MRFSILLVFVCFVSIVSAQCTRVSNNGKYAIDVYVNPIDVIINTTSCPSGYNYNLELSYHVDIYGLNGNTPPSSLYTLQGTFFCGSHQLFFNLPNSGGSGSLVTTANPYRNQSDCNTVTVADLMCSSFELQSHGPNSMNNSFMDCSPSSFLAVEVANDGIKQNANEIELSWETLSERESDYFLVEHSTDGTNWQVVDSIKAQGQSSELVYYSSRFHNIGEGYNYFKLSEMDLNGIKTLINFYVIDVKAFTSSIQMYPNPVKDELNIDGLENSDHNSFQLMDSKGKLIGLNMFSYITKGSRLIVKCGSLQKGIYFLKFSSGKTLRVIKS